MHSHQSLKEIRTQRAQQRQRFAAKQKIAGRWISLAEVVDWLSKLNASGDRSASVSPGAVADVVHELKGAILSGAFASSIGDRKSVRLIIADPDQPAGRISQQDIDSLRRSSFIDDPDALENFILRLWAPHTLVLNLFVQRRWPMPLWLQPTATPKDAKPRNKGGRPSEYNWAAAKTVALEIVGEYGKPAPSNKKLPTLAQFYEVLRERYFQPLDQNPEDSTIEYHAKKWLAKSS